MKPQDRKTEITHVAARLFKEKGYSAVTMRDIAQDMDIKAASLYNHIKSKQEILVLVVIEIAEEFTQVMNQIVASDCTALQKIEKVIELHIDITLRNPDALACLNNDWMHLANPQLGHFIKMREDYEANFKNIVIKGVAEGEINNRNTDVIIFSILSSLRTFYIWHHKTKNLSADEVKSNMVSVLLNGIS